LGVALPDAAAAGRTHAASVTRLPDGRYLYLVAAEGVLTLHAEKVSGETGEAVPDKGVRLAGADGLWLQEGVRDTALMLCTREGDLWLAWACGIRGFAFHTRVTAGAALEKALADGGGVTALGQGVPTGMAFDRVSGSPVLVGWEAAASGTVWSARMQGGAWVRECVTAGAGATCPRVAVAPDGTAHAVWRDGQGAVWHLERDKGGVWLRGGGTSAEPERIGFSAGEPAVAAVRHQVLAVTSTAEGQLTYSLYTGQGWNRNLALTALDKRWKGDRLSLPAVTLDGHGVPWLFFANNTGQRRFAYYTRWLGFGWDTIREGRGMYHASGDFLENLAVVEGCHLPTAVVEGDSEFGLLLVNRSVPRPWRLHRIRTPRPVARPGADILFMDMLEVGEILWAGQELGKVVKHPENPVLRPSGDPQALDSHRVFNGGTVLRDGEGYKVWYSASNPVGDWDKWWDLLHFCYATSQDGIAWQKPVLGAKEFKGGKQNNALPGVNIFMPVIPNPDGGAARFVGYTPGRGERWSSADGIHWDKQPVTCRLLGKQPKWFVYNSVLHDPDAPPARRWRAYGCMCPNEPPVRRTIAYAYSADGVNFTGPVENPIFQAETGGHWAKVHDVSVIKYKGHYVMVYQTGDGYDQHLELAVSRDGENFTRVQDGQAFIPQGKGDAWDRGLHLPSRPLVLENEIRLYYGGADYQAPGDPFDYERWKMCRMGMGLATLPVDGWAHVRNDPGRNVGYLTTVPITTGDVQECVLVANADVDGDHYLLAELLHAGSEERIPGYEHENCDKLVRSGPGQCFSWKGKSGLQGVNQARFRARILFRGKGETPAVRSLGFRRVAGCEAPQPALSGKEVVDRALVYESSVSRLAPLKAWIAYRPDGKPKPVVVAMHGFGEPVIRHGGRRMLGTVRNYAGQGLFAVAPDLRGREESAGQRDDGGVEVMDIYDAVQAALAQYPAETDPANINMIGWSGGGGNTFSAVTRMPDLFSNAAAFYGITDYGHWADTAYKGVIQPNVGGGTDEVPDRYLARNSLRGVLNNRYTDFHFFWDAKERICPPWMDEEYRRIAQELGRTNIVAHESRESDTFRWLHEGMSAASAAEANRLIMPRFTGRANPAPALDPEGRLAVLGYLMTKRFRVVFGHGNDAAAEVAYRLSPESYRFAFTRLSSDPDTRGWLRVTDRPAETVARVGSTRGDLAWEVTGHGHVLIRDIRPDDEITVRFK
jgi:dienelactone hydrolase/predicted GH43/DUF377 family glycosyl hydrolase